MKLFALALDYDGTIAVNDALDPLVRDAIAAARTSGIAVLLVTGRILDELRRVAGDLHFVDAVIAENGAVLHFPESDHTTRLAPEVPAAFAAALGQQAIAFRAGHSLFDASTTGTFLCAGLMTANAVTTGDEFTIPIGDLDASFATAA